MPLSRVSRDSSHQVDHTRSVLLVTYVCMYMCVCIIHMYVCIIHMYVCICMYRCDCELGEEPDLRRATRESAVLSTIEVSDSRIKGLNPSLSVDTVDTVDTTLFSFITTRSPNGEVVLFSSGKYLSSISVVSIGTAVAVVAVVRIVAAAVGDGEGDGPNDEIVDPAKDDLKIEVGDEGPW